jgi:hypothetical protein
VADILNTNVMLIFNDKFNGLLTLMSRSIV